MEREKLRSLLEDFPLDAEQRQIVERALSRLTNEAAREAAENLVLAERGTEALFGTVGHMLEKTEHDAAVAISEFLMLAEALRNNELVPEHEIRASVRRLFTAVQTQQIHLADASLLILVLGEIDKLIQIRMSHGSARADRRDLALALINAAMARNTLAVRIGRHESSVLCGGFAEALLQAELVGILDYDRDAIDQSMLDELGSLQRIIPNSPESALAEADPRFRQKLKLDSKKSIKRVRKLLGHYGDILRYFSVCEMWRLNSTEESFGCSVRANLFYKYVISMEAEHNCFSAFSLLRYSRGLILEAKLRALVGDHSTGLLTASALNLASIVEKDTRMAGNYRLLMGAVEALLYVLALEPKNRAVADRAESMLLPLIEIDSEWVLPVLKALVRLYRDILRDTRRGVAALGDRLPAAERMSFSKSSLIRHAIGMLQASGLDQGMEAGSICFDEAIDLLEREPDNFRLLKLALNAYLNERSAGVNGFDAKRFKRRLLPMASNCPLYLLLMWAVVEIDLPQMAWAAESEQGLLLTAIRLQDNPSFAPDGNRAPSMQMRIAIELGSRFFLERGRLWDSESDYKRCERLASLGLSFVDDVYWVARIVDARMRLGNLDAAQETINSGLARHEDDPVLKIAKAKIALRKGMLGEAEAVLDSLIAHDVKQAHSAPRHLLAVVSWRRGIAERAESLWRGALDANPLDWRAAFGLARVLCGKGDGGRLEAERLWAKCFALTCDGDWPYQQIAARRSARCMAASLSGLGSEDVDVARGHEVIALINNVPPEGAAMLIAELGLVGVRSTRLIMDLTECANARRNANVLRQAVAQLIMATLIERSIHNEELDDLLEAAAWVKEWNLLGDLFAGAKGVYLRALLRLRIMPNRIRSFEDAVSREAVVAPLRSLIEHVSTDGWVPNYYARAYEMCAELNEWSAPEVLNAAYVIARHVALKLSSAPRLHRDAICVSAAPAFWQVGSSNGKRMADQDDGLAWVDLDMLKFVHSRCSGKRLESRGDTIEWEGAVAPDLETEQVLARGGIALRKYGVGRLCYSVERNPGWGMELE